MDLNGKRPGIMTHRLKICILLLLLLLPGERAATAGTPASPYGVNVHAPQGPELASPLDKVQAAAFAWVRIDFIWAAVENRKGRYDWHVYDAIAAAAKARGIDR